MNGSFDCPTTRTQIENRQKGMFYDLDANLQNLIVRLAHNSAPATITVTTHLSKNSMRKKQQKRRFNGRRVT